MTAPEAEVAMIDVRRAYAHFDAMEGISRTLEINYKDASIPSRSAVEA